MVAFSIEDIVQLNFNMLVPYYLMSCYLYYECGVSVLSDKDFDLLSEMLYETYDQLSHWHKDLIDKESIRVSGFYLKYPLRVRQAAKLWYALYIKEKTKSF